MCEEQYDKSLWNICSAFTLTKISIYDIIMEIKHRYNYILEREI